MITLSNQDQGAICHKYCGDCPGEHTDVCEWVSINWSNKDLLTLA